MTGANHVIGAATAISMKHNTTCTENQRAVPQILKAGALYFTLVFGAGFVLGPIRILWLVPRFRERTADLMEAPFMLVVILLSARWIARRFVVAPEAFKKKIEEMLNSAEVVAALR